MGLEALIATAHSHIVAALLLALASPASAVVLHNITLALPAGSSDHGTPGLLCTPTKAIDLIIFYLLNYIAHAATVLTRPGERADDYIASVIGSLLFPTLGLYRGIDAILCGAVFVKNDDLRKAAKSGALCVVVRDADWRPQDGEVLHHSILRRAPSHNHSTDEASEKNLKDIGNESINAIHLLPFSPPYMSNHFGLPAYVHRRIIHGTHILPAGYRFAILPPDTQFAPPTPSYASSARSTVAPSPGALSPSPTVSSATSRIHSQIEISAPYNIVKALIALLQSFYTLMTLYRSRGDQISRFGFASFGLTVAPFAVMSLMNLVGNLCRPEYPSLYMVESSVMDEARGRGGVFSGAVASALEGKIEDSEEGTGVEGHVCACTWADGEEAGDVKFVKNGEGILEARFHTTDPLSYTKAREEKESRTIEQDPSREKGGASISTSPRATNSPRTTQSHPLAPIPHKLNYAGTSPCPFILLPNHPPLLRSSPSPSPPDTPPQNHAISTVTLSHPYIFTKHQCWTIRYADSLNTRRALRARVSKYALTLLISLTPVIVNGILSKFRVGSTPESETSTWRVFIAQWMSFGVLTGLWWVVDQEAKDALPGVGYAGGQIGPWGRVLGYVVSASPAVGGYIVVGQMLYRYGVCTWIGD